MHLAGTCEQALRFASSHVYDAILPGAGANAYQIKPVERSAPLAIVRDQLAARAKTTTSAR